MVGTYGVLTPSATRRLGALYSDGEFDLVRLRHLRAHLPELGRSRTDLQVRPRRSPPLLPVAANDTVEILPLESARLGPRLRDRRPADAAAPGRPAAGLLEALHQVLTYSGCA